MRYYAKPDSHIWDKVKVVLDLSNCGIKRKLNNAAGVDTSNLAAKSDFIGLKALKNCWCSNWFE